MLVERGEPNWGCESNGDYGIIIPRDPESSTDMIQIRAILARRDTALEARWMKNGYREIRSHGLGFTAFFYVENMGPQAKAYFNSAEVNEVSPYRAARSHGISVLEADNLFWG